MNKPNHSTPRADLFQGTDSLPPLTPPAWFVPEAESLGIAFDHGDTEKLGRFLNLLLTVNTRTNLTAIKEPEDAWRKHILDSLTLIPYIAELQNLTHATNPRVIDVGSGAGLPAIPLAVCMPHIRFTALDSTAKKTAFIDHAATTLGLTNIQPINDRAENLGQSPDHRARYHAAIARAVGPIAVLAELTVPLLTTPGLALLVKGERAESELADAKHALHALHARHETTNTTPTGRIVVIAKDRPTPHAYPRKPGEPKRAPLGA